MATQLQIRRGTTAQMNAFTGAEGELAVNTTTDTVHVHDGSSAGGFALAKADGSNIGTYAGSFTTLAASSTLTAQKLVSTNGVLELDDNGSHNGVINVPASLFINIDSDNGATGEDFVIAKDRTGTSGGTELFRVQEDGSVGIGTSSIDGTLHVHTASAGTVTASSQADDLVIENSAEGGMTIITPDDQSARIRFTSPSTTADVGGASIFYRQNINKMSMGTEVAGGILALKSGAGSDGLLLDASGNVEMRGSANVRISLGTAGGSGANNSSNWIYGNGTNLRFNNAGGYYSWETLGTERMRIDSSGNLLVGRTSAGATGNGHSIRGGDSAVFSRASTGETMQVCRDTSHGDFIRFKRNNISIGTIAASGSTTSYNTSSDQRLKENIADADDAGSKVDSIQVRKFDWKVDGSHQDYGMVAQELQAVAPEAVSTPEDPEEMMSVDYSKLVPMMLKEIQSLRARVNALEAE